MRDVEGKPFEAPPAEGGNFLAGVGDGLHDALVREERNPFEILREAVKLQRKPNQLTIREYFEWRLYRRGLDETARRTFIGLEGSGPLLTRMIDRDHLATARDKILWHQIASSEGLPVPGIVAFYHPYRSLASAKPLRSPEEVADFLLSEDALPLFSKPVGERKSAATQAWAEVDRSSRTLVTRHGAEVPLDDFIEAIEDFVLAGYLFQELLRPDERLEEICGSTVSTVRMMVLLDDRSPHLFRASWKIPVEGNVADNFWRPGNMLASVDVETGEVRRVVGGLGAEQESFDRHPETDAALTGRAFPDWERICALVVDGARLFPGVGIQAWDVALTRRGPVAVEMNYGGHPMLVQLAHETGIYDEEFREIMSRRHDPSEAEAWWA